MAEVSANVLVLSYHELRKPHLGFTQSCDGRLAPAFSVKPNQYVDNVFRIGNMISDVVIYIRIFLKSHIILVRIGLALKSHPESVRTFVVRDYKSHKYMNSIAVRQQYNHTIILYFISSFQKSVNALGCNITSQVWGWMKCPTRVAKEFGHNCIGASTSHDFCLL